LLRFARRQFRRRVLKFELLANNRVGHAWIGFFCMGRFLCGFEGGVRLHLPTSRQIQRLFRLSDLSSQLRDLSLRRCHFAPNLLDTQYIFLYSAHLFRRG